MFSLVIVRCGSSEVCGPVHPNATQTHRTKQSFGCLTGATAQSGDFFATRLGGCRRHHSTIGGEAA